MADVIQKIYANREEFNNGAVVYTPTAKLADGATYRIDDQQLKRLSDINHGFKAAHFETLYDDRFDDYPA